MTTYETLLVEVSDRVAVITLNRPEVRNAINAQVQTDLRAALDALRGDDSVGAVVLTGAGEKAFAAGADIGQLRSYDLHTGLASSMQRLYDEVETFEKPTIAAVNGYALGGGCELAMACDIRIAAGTARFGLPETNLSVLPGAGGTQRLARLVGVGRAIDLILTGDLLTADEALATGLVTRVTEPETLLATAREVARSILAKGPLAVRLARTVIRTGMDTDLRTGLVVEQLAQSLLYTTDDKREGAQAFLAKRTPNWSGL
ncbi:Enoyl-CoA hydratase/carnithine racemase [Nocardioides sp. YR527]|uniref:enoyl-CoA hydratase/isomerase family protein n=1 Tax=Nocardioides sp. YR527 TaxID=1881028 RepID=UPI00087E980E|nr:enoyl-CoA hydratase-related protein [Nocardioides sp. YR527]SDK06794.1 Enoyl-CoA hydratase/carnithine racemase [Nocardioides sp. YR527]